VARTASAGPSTRPREPALNEPIGRSTAATRLLCADAAALDLPEDALDPTTVLAGAPQASFLALGERQGSEIGVWELTEGEVADVEADEVFVVLPAAAACSSKTAQPSRWGRARWCACMPATARSGG
jgi:hypothetical protein